MTWTEKYNIHRAMVGRWSIVVSWPLTGNETGYGVTFERARVNTRFADLDEAKAAGISLARAVLTRALAELPPKGETA